jgi:acyl-CoA synthetase (NDP forming)
VVLVSKGAAAGMHEWSFSIADLTPLFRPRSVAIVGASRAPGKNSHYVVRNLVRCGYAGRIFPVNPVAEEIEGLPCYASLAEIPERPDCAMLVIPASETVEATQQCADAGVRAVIIGASGFAEMGTAEGVSRQAQLKQIAHASGMILLGPNTNGILNANDRLSLGYNAEHGERFEAGPVSIISHSGALFGGVVRTLRHFGVGISKFVPVGNEAALNMLDILEYVIDDAATGVIGLVMEGISDGARLRRLAKRAREAVKPIVALKVGRSMVGIEAALAHSSRLAGGTRAYDALLLACGIASVRSVEALTGACALLAMREQAAIRSDRRLICVATSGAGGALMADFAADRHMVLAGGSRGEWEGEVAAATAKLKTSGRIRNPIDMGSLARDWSQLGLIYAALERDGLNGPTAVYAHIAPQPKMNEILLSSLAERKQRTGAPIVIVAPGGLDDDIEARYIDHGIPVYHDITTCFESLNCHFSTLADDASALVQTIADTPDVRDLADLLRGTCGTSGTTRVLSELASATIIRAAGVPVVESRIVASSAEAVETADQLQYPVVLKALAPGIAHKNAYGLVTANIFDAATLSKAYRRLERRITDLGHLRTEVTLLVQPMIASMAELIIGISSEPSLGLFLVAGLGGIHAEELDEAVLIAIPASREAIVSSIASSVVGRILARVSKDSGRDDIVGRLVDAMQALQRIATLYPDLIESVDINPLLLTPTGFTAVDALVVVAAEAS